MATVLAGCTGDDPAPATDLGELEQRQVADLTVEAVEGGCPEKIDYDRDEPPGGSLPTAPARSCGQRWKTW
jgi:hypothetical protein